MPVAHYFPWREANLYTYFIGCNFRHYTKMASDGNDRRVYVGNLPPDIRTKVIHLFCSFKPAFLCSSGFLLLNVGFELLLRLFPCAQVNLCYPDIQSIGSGFTECRSSYNGSGFMMLLNPDPDPGCCWIRIQSKVLFMTKLLTNWQLDFFLQTPTKDFQTPQTWNFFPFFSFLVDIFALPAGSSGFPIWIRIRIRWPTWILFKSGSETLPISEKLWIWTPNNPWAFTLPVPRESWVQLCCTFIHVLTSLSIHIECYLFSIALKAVFFF